MTGPVRFDDLAVGEEIPPLSREVRPDDVRLYAEASGDLNPLHLDEGFARNAGFPGIIAHGMFTMGHLASCLTRWAGDPSAITRMRVAFRSTVQMGDTIVAGGRVKALDRESRRVTLDVWVTVARNGGSDYAIRRSEVEVRLP